MEYIWNAAVMPSHASFASERALARTRAPSERARPMRIVIVDQNRCIERSLKSAALMLPAAIVAEIEKHAHGRLVSLAGTVSNGSKSQKFTAAPHLISDSPFAAVVHLPHDIDACHPVAWPLGCRALGLLWCTPRYAWRVRAFICGEWRTRVHVELVGQR